MATTVWLILLVGFVIAEAACPIHLISIWFAVGALAAAVTAMLNGAIWLQTVVFLVVSAALLASLWPFVKKFLNPHLTKTNVDSVIGSQGYVTEAVDNLTATGQVKLGGMYWTARSADGRPIPAGTLIQVDHVEGVKVIVTPVKEKVEL